LYFIYSDFKASSLKFSSSWLTVTRVYNTEDHGYVPFVT